jgi:hypothetical protein
MGPTKEGGQVGSKGMDIFEAGESEDEENPDVER